VELEIGLGSKRLYAGSNPALSANPLASNNFQSLFAVLPGDYRSRRSSPRRGPERLPTGRRRARKCPAFFVLSLCLVLAPTAPITQLAGSREIKSNMLFAVCSF
jgi:hypothetical protein